MGSVGRPWSLAGFGELGPERGSVPAALCLTARPDPSSRRRTPPKSGRPHIERRSRFLRPSWPTISRISVLGPRRRPPRDRQISRRSTRRRARARVAPRVRARGAPWGHGELGDAGARGARRERGLGAAVRRRQPRVGRGRPGLLGALLAAGGVASRAARTLGGVGEEGARRARRTCGRLKCRAGAADETPSRSGLGCAGGSSRGSTMGGLAERAPSRGVLELYVLRFGLRELGFGQKDRCSRLLMRPNRKSQPRADRLWSSGATESSSVVCVCVCVFEICGLRRVSHPTVQVLLERAAPAKSSGNPPPRTSGSLCPTASDDLTKGSPSSLLARRGTQGRRTTADTARMFEALQPARPTEAPRAESTAEGRCRGPRALLPLGFVAAGLRTRSRPRHHRLSIHRWWQSATLPPAAATSAPAAAFELGKSADRGRLEGWPLVDERPAARARRSRREMAVLPGASGTAEQMTAIEARRGSRRHDAMADREDWRGATRCIERLGA